MTVELGKPPPVPPDPGSGPASLRLRKLIPAQPEQVFGAWTDPEALKIWWGPKGVRCLSAEIDLTVGGDYRIENELPDQSILWIVGRFEVIERPDLLVYTWGLDTPASSTERVSVRFRKHEEGTELILLHEMIPDKQLAARHQQGWHGCMDGLHDFLQTADDASA